MTLHEILHALVDVARVSDEARGELHTAVAELEGAGAPQPAEAAHEETDPATPAS